MNLLQLVLKQMRQRALGTWLTLLSVVLGVALAIAILILYREGRSVFGQTEYGFDLIVGPKGSSTQVVMNTVYHIDKSPGNVGYDVYERLTGPDFRREVRFATPFMVGDSYQNHRIVATLAKTFGFAEDGSPLEGYDENGALKQGYVSPNLDQDERNGAKPAAGALEYRPLKKYELAQGRMFHGEKFEAVIGAAITERTGLKLGDKFKATHGLPAPDKKPDIHDDEWTVVGVLKATNTAADRVLFTPLVTSYAIMEHGDALLKIEAVQQGKSIAEINRMRATLPTTTEAKKEDDHDDHDHDHDHGPKAYTLNDDGTVRPIIPKQAWEVSAILVKTRSFGGGKQLMDVQFAINNRAEAAAVNPASVMREFFDTFLAGSSMVLLVVSGLVTVVAAIGILVSIYNSVTARRKEIAILRALGATRQRVLVLICVEAAVVGVVGGLLGLVVGHLLGAAGSVFLNSLLGQGINWIRVDRGELLYLVGVVVLATLAGLVPALSAYKTPVATNLVSS